MKYKYFYILSLQYLGFRYHGWQKQPNVKTVELMLEKTLKTVLGHNKFKLLGSSRTDAMVSANCHKSEIFINEDINTEKIIEDLNSNLPADIKALNLEQTDNNFNIINSSKFKIYTYTFSNEKKANPFSAPFIANFQSQLDIELMKKGAYLFQGTHFFKRYCYKPDSKKDFVREIFKCEIIDNTEFTASFFPSKSYQIVVSGNGFLHHQVRLIAGALIRLGLHEISLIELKDSLKEEKYKPYPVGFVAPASGLMLQNINFD